MEINSFYDFVKNILEKTGDLTKDGTDFGLYNPNLVLQAFGFDRDINNIAMTLNVLPFLNKQAHYKYLYYAIPKQHKLGSWYANNRKLLQEQKKTAELVDAICYYYGCSQKDGYQALILFTPDECTKLSEYYKMFNDGA